MMVAEKKSEAALILEQIELFPAVTEAEVEGTLFWLRRYSDIKSIMQDFEQYASELALTAVEGETARRISSEEYYANKTANAVILAEKQRAVYEEYQVITLILQRANGVIKDKDARKAVELRYLRGYSYKEMILFFHHGMSDRTIERRLREGIVSMANTLQLMGFFETKWKY